MQDVELLNDGFGLFDIGIKDGQISSVYGLQTAIEVSLFTDARAPGSLVPDAHRRRGWVGNIKTAEDNRQIGSLLWLLDQSRLTTSIVSQGEIYAKQATLHFVEDDVASDVVVLVDRGSRAISINIDVLISNNTTERYNVLWRNIDGFGVS